MTDTQRSGKIKWCTIALVGLLATVALGADSMGPGRSIAGPSPMAEAEVQAFEFSGGELSRFIEAIQSRWPESNIMLEARAAAFVVPAMTLPQVTASSLLDMVADLRGTFEGREWRCMVTELPVQPGITLYRVEGRPLSARQPSESAHRIKVMSIASVLQHGYSVQQVRSSIAGVLGAAGFDPRNYTVHVDETTRVLAVHGSLQVTDATAAVLDSIEVSAQYRALQIDGEAATDPEHGRNPV